MKITNLPKDPGISGWAALAPEPDSSGELDQNLRADWLVIGAGFAGLAAARRLSQLLPTDRIVLLDAARVGDGPAGRNSGFMIDLPHDLSSENYAGALDDDRAQIEDNRRAIAFAAEMAREYSLPAEAADPVGKINAAATAKGQKHVESYAEHLKKLAEPFQLLDAAAMKEVTGINYYQAGLFTPGVIMLQPAIFVRGVAKGLQSNRVQLFEQSPVISLTKDADWIAETPKGQITAPNVILAVNGHLESFGIMERHLVHVHTYGSMTEEMSDDQVARLGGQPSWGITSADPMGTSVRKLSGQGGHRIVVRNRVTYDPDLVANDSQFAATAKDHQKSFSDRFPMLGDLKMEHHWGGRLCLSRNNVQVIGEVEQGLYAACCQNGLGTARGTLAGILAAEQACGVNSPALERALAAAPPKKLPPRLLSMIGASARLRWGEYQAGREL